MAIKFWKNDVIQKIYKNKEVIDAFRQELAETKLHIITVTAEELKDYVRQLRDSTPNGAGAPIGKKLDALTNKFYKDFRNAAKFNQPQLCHFVGETGTSFTIKTVGLYGYGRIRKIALDNFINELRKLKIDLNKQVKDEQYRDQNTGQPTQVSTETFMRRRLNFAHGDPNSQTTVGALKGLEIFDELEDNMTKSLKMVKGAEFDTAEVKQAIRDDLTSYYQHELKIDIKHEDPKKVGKVKDTYKIYGRVQSQRQNEKEYRHLDAATNMNKTGFGSMLVSKIEQAMLRTVGKKGADISASDKLSDRAADAIIANFRKKIKAKGTKVTGGGKAKTITSKRTTGAVKNATPPKTALKKLKAGKNIKKSSKITNMAGVGTGLIRQQQRQRTQRSNIALAGLMTRLNSALPYMVRENMGSPRLNYRGTGREGPFTSTVRVTGVTPMNRKNPEAGGVNINYTYGLYPYQTFEPGFEQGDFYRDPRKLIEESIFELARNIKSEYFMRGIAMRRTATGRDYRFKRGK